MEEKNLQEMEIVENEMDTYTEPDNTGNVKIGVVAALAAGAGAALLWHKTKKMRRKHSIKKLEKDGYVVSKLDDGITEVEAIDVEVTENVEQ